MSSPSVELVQKLFRAGGMRLVRSSTYDEYQAFRYSHRHQPDLTRFAIRELQRKKGGDVSFVQVGANDGMRDDEFREYVEAFGLSGLMIEPQPGAYSRLASRYAGNPRIQTANCAVSRESGHIPMYVFKDQAEDAKQLDVFSSIDPAVIQRAKELHGIRSEIVKIEVPSLTFDELIRRYGIQAPDVLIVDTEGYDFEILKMVDLRTLRPTLIQLEYINLTAADVRGAMEHLVNHGYTITVRNAEIVAIFEDVLAPAGS